MEARVGGGLGGGGGGVREQSAFDLEGFYDLLI